MSYALGQSQIDRIEDILKGELIDNGVLCVFLIDMAGNIITSTTGKAARHYSLAALAAGNFGAVSAMAKTIGENDFQLLFQGKKKNIHFTKIASEFLLVTIFGNDTSLGILRMKVSESVDQLKDILDSLRPCSVQTWAPPEGSVFPAIVRENGMAFINLKHKLIQDKIIYYGPGRGGKTTNLEYIHRIQRPYFPASALKGTNVVATLKKIITLTIASIRKELH